MSTRIAAANDEAVLLLESVEAGEPTLMLVCVPGNAVDFNRPEQARNLAAALVQWARTVEEPASR